MKYREAIKKIGQGELFPILVFYGEEEYLKNRGVEAALAALDIQTPELNLSFFEERPDPGDVARALETLPFMSAHRAVVVRNTDILAPVCGGEYSEVLAKAQIPPSNVLIIHARGKADKRKALAKRAEKEGLLVECDPPDGRELAAFIAQEAKRHNLMISPRNAELLCELCGGDLGTAVNEVEKLTLVCRGTINKEEIEKYVSRSMQYNVYRIHDLFCAGNPEGAKQLIEKMLDEDPNPVGFLSLVAGNFKQMLIARACRDAGYSEGRTVASVTEETGVREWAARRAVQNCRILSADRLRRAIERLARLDFESKQGGVVLKTDLFPLLFGLYAKC